MRSGSSVGAGALAGSGDGVVSVKLSSDVDVSVTGGFSLWIVCAADS